MQRAHRELAGCSVRHGPQARPLAWRTSPVSRRGPAPMLLGRKPIPIATMASTVATRMAAAAISNSFSVAQSCALCQVVEQGSGTAGASPRGNATCIKVVWLAARRRCAKVRALPCGDHRDASPVCLWGEGSRGCAPPVEWSGHLMKSARSERWQLPRHSSSGDGPEARAARATAS
jgi:hypothetical protein